MKNNQVEYLEEALNQIGRMKMILAVEIEGQTAVVVQAIAQLDHLKWYLEDLLERKRREANAVDKLFDKKV